MLTDFRVMHANYNEGEGEGKGGEGKMAKKAEGKMATKTGCSNSGLCDHVPSGLRCDEME